MKIAKSVNKLGTEAVYNIFAKTKQLVKQGKSIIDLSLGQSDFKSPTHAVEAAIQALKDGQHGYTLPNGMIECREAVSRKIKSLYKVSIGSERIVIMPGGKPTMNFAISLFGEPGAEIIYPDPGSPKREMAKFIVGLPPGIITILSDPILTLYKLLIFLLTASLHSIIPFGNV
jgi:aspartate/methionine/tyrosine aminotransferase